METVTAPAPAPSGAPVASAIVAGPRWYRGRIRLWGPFLGLLIPALVGFVAYGALRWFDTAWSGAVGLIGAVLAAPTLLAVGAPFSDRDLYPLAVAAGGVVWLLVGLLASRRATRNPMATWADFWRHYLVMLVGIWVGAGAALMIATISIGESLY